LGLKCNIERERERESGGGLNIKTFWGLFFGWFDIFVLFPLSYSSLKSPWMGVSFCCFSWLENYVS